MSNEANLAAFSLETATPSELEQRRRNIVSAYPPGSNVDEMTLDHLKELAAITSAMRRKTATGPKSAKKAATRSKKQPATSEDLFNAFS